MLDLNVILIMGTIFLMFLISLATAKKAADNRMKAIAELFAFFKKVSPFKDDEPESGYGMTETGKKYLLDEYKSKKRVRLIVNGNVLEDLTLAEHENLAVLNGVDPDSPVEFRVQLGGEKESDEPLKFPSN